MTNQPDWKCVANLGDVTPWDYGGAFVLVDKTGVYTPELRVFEVIDGPPVRWEEHTILLERCTFVNGILSDNPYHQDHKAWFADSLPVVAHFTGIPKAELIRLFCSEDPVQRAEAYQAVYVTHGPQEAPDIRRIKMVVMNRMKKWLREAESEAA